MIKNFIIKFTFALCFLFITSEFSAFAQEGAPAPPDKMGKPDKRMKVENRNWLKLTQEQKSKMQEIHQGYSDQIEDIQLGIMKKRLELAEELKKDEPDRKKIEAIITGMLQLEEKKQRIIIDEFFAIRNLLTPDQRKIYVRRFIRQMTAGTKKFQGPNE